MFPRNTRQSDPAGGHFLRRLQVFYRESHDVGGDCALYMDG